MLKKNKDKFAYKLAIKNAKNASANAITEELHESLLNKTSNAFWKTWKNKVCVGTNNSKVRLIDECSDQDAANKFAEFFKGTCSPNTQQFNEDKKKLYEDQISSYVGDTLDKKFSFSAETIAIAVAKLELGKAPGTDKLTT